MNFLLSNNKYSCEKLNFYYISTTTINYTEYICNNYLTYTKQFDTYVYIKSI